MTIPPQVVTHSCVRCYGNDALRWHPISSVDKLRCWAIEIPLNDCLLIALIAHVPLGASGR